MQPLSSTAELRIVNGVATSMTQSLQLARMNMEETGLAIDRISAERDQVVAEAALLCRENAVLRGSRENIEPHRRPVYSPAQRMEIVQVMRLRE